MRRISLTLAVLLVWALVSPAMAGISVTSYSTTALTNGFAPSFQGPYFAQETLENVTPALADVSGDWTGPNADGTPATWHFVGASQSSTTTAFHANSYTVTAAGSFTYALNTTAAFVDPRPSVLTPGGAANYEGFFNTDVPVAYSIVGQLSRQARVRLNTSSGLVILNQSNPTSVPVPVNLSGTIPPGQYRVLLTTGLAVPGFPNGVNQYEASGSYDEMIFAVQVPEPSYLKLGLVISIIGTGVRRRRRGECA